MIDTNEIFADSDSKLEKYCKDLKNSRIRLGNSKYLKSADDFSKFMKFNYGDSNLDLDKNHRKWHQKFESNFRVS